MTINPKEALDMPVLAAASGRKLGSVDNFLFDPGEHRLYGIVLKGETDGRQFIIHREDVRSFGDAAIIVQDEQAAQVLEADEKGRRLSAAGGHLGGMKILTEDGNEVGKVDTVLLNADGAIVSYRSSGGFLGFGTGKDISVADVVTAGSDAIIVKADATQ